MRVVVHIGWPRTGTTSIQRCLSANKSGLARQGLCYPAAGRHARGTAIGHHGFAWSVRGKTPDWATYDVVDPAAVLAEMLAEAAGRTLVISSEAFSTFPPSAIDRLAALLQGQEASIVCYARRAEEWAPSMHRWRIRSSMERSAFAETDYFEKYEALLRRSGLYREAFGAGFRVFDYGAIEDTAAHFVALIGAKVEAKPVRRGQSFDGRLTNLFMALNDALALPTPQRRLLYGEIEEAWRRGGEGPDDNWLAAVLDVLRSTPRVPEGERAALDATVRSAFNRPPEVWDVGGYATRFAAPYARMLEGGRS